MKTYLIAALAVLAVAGCAPMERIGLDWPAKRTERPEPVVQDEPIVEETLPADEVEEAQPAEKTGLLGVTVASLGDPAKAGFWIETPLVQAAGKGRVSYAKTGRTVKVDLIPIDGPATAGSRLSLATMRLLDAPLTGLPEVKVYRD
ncbi:hypothetical protein [Thalassovita sp.]|uniref:hypothetical protein n=1 Tax=Thalassovita sp. TaxID=1979401 RepID=UPI0029DE899F|nr:hypothetical protein [Thalassovita sp.]